VDLAERYRPVEKLSSQCFQQSLTDRVCLGSSIRCLQNAQAQVSNGFVECLREDAVAIVDEEPIFVLRWDRFSKLLERPLSGRMRGHVAVQDLSRSVLHHNQYVEHSKRRGHRDAKVASDDGLGMVAKSGRSVTPLLRHHPRFRAGSDYCGAHARHLLPLGKRSCSEEPTA